MLPGLFGPATAGQAPLAVVPVLVGPLQALLAILPGLLIALGGILVSLFKPRSMKRLALLAWRQKIPVALLVGGMWALSYAWGLAFPAAAGAVATREFASAAWPLFRGGPSRRAAALDAEDPSHGGVEWSFFHDDIRSFYCSPAAVGNRVYATSARWEVFKKDGALYSLDADTGRLVWMFNGHGYRATFSSPAVDGKYLVVGEGLHLTDNARVFCFDVERSEQTRAGVVLWEYRTGSHVESSPCIADGKVFIGAGDDGLYCFDLAPGGGAPSVRWHLEGREYPDCETSPVWSDGRVYFCLGLGGQAICCVEADTGALVWKIPTPYPVFSSPSISDGRLLAGMGWGDFVNTAEAVAALQAEKLRAAGKSPEEIRAATAEIRPVGEVWCVNLAPQGAPEGARGYRIEWKFPVGRTVLGAVAVADGRAYFGSRDQHLYSVSIADPKDSVRWNARAPIVTSPAVARRHVYVVTETGRLVGLDRNTLSPTWEVSLNSPSMSSPAVARGHVYVGTAQNGMLCIGRPGRGNAEAVWAGALGGPGHAGSIDGSLVPAQGRFAWRFPKTEGACDLSIRAPAAYLPGALYVGFGKDGAGGLMKCAFARAPGEGDARGWQLDREPAAAWVRPAAHPVYLSPAAAGGAVLFVDGREGDRQRALHCLDAGTGEVRWQHAVGDGSGRFVVAAGMAFVADTARGISCLDASATPPGGSARWHAAIGEVVGDPAVCGDLLAAAVRPAAPEGPAARGEIAILDLHEGALLRREALDGAPTTGAVFAGGRIWVGTPSGLCAVGIVEPPGGGPDALTRLPVGPVEGRLAARCAQLACTTAGGALVLVDPEGAAVRRRLEDAAGALPPLVTDGAILYLAPEAINRYDARAGTSDLWAQVRPSWPGVVVSPMIMVESHVIFATETRGVVCLKPKN